MSADASFPDVSAEAATSADPRDQRLVLVTGAGRSGTSTVAGTLHFLGLHVPLPVVKPNKSNPMGFFESKWPVRFHRRLMERAFVELTDGRPEAQRLMAEAVTPEIRAELRTWLAEVAAAAPELVVKDPRSCWVPWLWKETAGELGIEVGYLTMIRHPAEVLGSRTTYYRDYRPNLDDWQFSVMNLCGWINGNLVVERQTRDDARVVLRYDDLIEDWRSCMARVRDAFGLTFDDDLQSGHRHAVDDFIDPALRRHEPSWESWDMPAELVEIGQGVYNAMCRLADSDGHDREAEAAMDALATRYAGVMRSAQAIAGDTVVSARKATAARAAADQKTREADLQKQLAEAHERGRETVTAATGRASGPLGFARRVYGGARRRMGRSGPRPGR
jgi:hypothetical protein